MQQVQILLLDGDANYGIYEDEVNTKKFRPNCYRFLGVLMDKTRKTGGVTVPIPLGQMRNDEVKS